MWYNKIVMNEEKVIDREKRFVNEEDMWSIEEECGIDIMGYFICEFWSEE